MKGQKTGGRTAGTPNKATTEIKTLAQAYGPDAIERLWRLACEAESDAGKVAALKEILDRGYGKPTQTIAGDPDNPLFSPEVLRAAFDAKLDRIFNAATAPAAQDTIN